jgi:putative spermidine/putrescine transport system ATP-binding protein
LRHWQKELGLTFIHVTHSQEEAMALADWMVVMNHGRIEQQGAPHHIYNRPDSEFVARFMGGHNIIETPAGKVGVRTDHITVTPATQAGPPDLHNLWADITDIEYQGTYVLLGLQRPGSAPGAGNNTAEFSVMLSEARFAQCSHALGDRVQLAWPPGAAHPLPA